MEIPLREGRTVRVSASSFRQDAETLFLVRFAGTAAAAPPERAGQSSVLDLIAKAPDGFVVTDLDGRVLTANRAFLDIAQLATEDQAKGRLLGDWLGRPGADLPVLLSMLKKHGAVRVVATAARGEHGAVGEVEVSAVWAPDATPPTVGFVVRDIGRRVAAGPQGARDLTRAVEQLTGLVGRVSLPELLRDTVELVERHFVEAALELTNDNRTAAAEVLGLSRQSLYMKLRRHSLLVGADEREQAS
jgi:transcriptional regulator PpsR